MEKISLPDHGYKYVFMLDPKDDVNKDTVKRAVTESELSPSLEVNEKDMMMSLNFSTMVHVRIKK